jgi:hypothetical protein
VRFTHTGAGTLSASVCDLRDGSCAVAYTPSAAGPATTTAGYDATALHQASQGSATIATAATAASTGPAPTAAPQPVAVSPARNPVQVTRLRHGRLRLRYTRLAPGTLRVELTARGDRGHGRIGYAHAHRRLSADRITIVVTPTAAGRRQLRGRRWLRVRITTTYAQAGLRPRTSSIAARARGARARSTAASPRR